MGTEIITSKKGVIKSDKEYIEAYFDICELLNRKRRLLGFGKSNTKKPGKPESEEELKKRKQGLAAINKKLKEKDNLFWKRAERALKDKKEFAAEKLASFYSLDIFEKKVLLFFLYLELYHPENRVCSEAQIVSLFDFDGSIVERVKRLRYFRKDSPLIKNSILFKEDKLFYPYPVKEYVLSDRFLKMLSDVLNGEELKKAAEKKQLDTGIDEVGHEKSPQYSLDDVKLKSKVKENLMFFLSNYKENLLEKIGAGETIKGKDNLIFLFYGSPGTGKSMLAEAIAGYLDKKVLMVDFPKIMSCWLGQTDNNIVKVFKTAKENKMLLCLDEADTLLYSRDSGMANYNIRFVNVMLREIEKFEGVAVLTTNMDMLLDQALQRRVSLKVKFEVPDDSLRAQIWRSHIPKKVQLSGNIDFTALAKKYEFAGGYIKNAVLNALRKVSLEKQKALTMEDLIFGAEIEKEGIFYKNKKNMIKGFSQ